MTTVSIQSDLRGVFGAARDQGRRPTCIAFAMSDLHAFAHNPWGELSTEYLFFHANSREVVPDPHAGVGITSIRAALHEEGQPVESGWPYLAMLPSDLATWNPPPDVGTLHSHESVTTPADFDDAWDLAITGQPMLLAMSISKSFFAPGLSGVVDSNEAVEHARRHAVVVVGAGQLGSARCLLVRNSWGGAWGSGGHAWLTEDYLRPRIIGIVVLK